MVLEAEFQEKAEKTLVLKRKLDQVISRGSLEKQLQIQYVSSLDSRVQELIRLRLQMIDEGIGDYSNRLSNLGAISPTMSQSLYLSRIEEYKGKISKLKDERNTLETQGTDGFLRGLEEDPALRLAASGEAALGASSGGAQEYDIPGYVILLLGLVGFLGFVVGALSHSASIAVLQPLLSYLSILVQAAFVHLATRILSIRTVSFKRAVSYIVTINAAIFLLFVGLAFLAFILVIFARTLTFLLIPLMLAGMLYILFHFMERIYEITLSEAVSVIIIIIVLDIVVLAALYFLLIGTLTAILLSLAPKRVGLPGI